MLGLLNLLIRAAMVTILIAVLCVPQAGFSRETAENRKEKNKWGIDLAQFITAVASVENKNLPYDFSRLIGLSVVYAGLDERFRRYGLSYSDTVFLLMGIIKVESNFNPVARSYANALGLMQIHLPTWKIEENKAKNIVYNILFGKEVLLYYLEKTSGDIRTALWYYNGSRGYVGDRYALSVLRSANRYLSIYRELTSRQ